MILTKNKLTRAILISLPVYLLSVQVNAGYLEEVSSNGGSKSAVEFAKYAEKVPNSELQTLLGSVSGSEAEQLASDMLADSNGAAINATLQNASMMHDVLLSRSEAIRNQDAMGAFNFGWNTWVSALSAKVSGDSGYDITGYDTTTLGLMIGADKYVIADRAYIGYSLAYANNDSESDDNLSDVTNKNVQLLTYAGWLQESRFLDVILNIGKSTVSSSRTIRADNNANVTASYDQLNMGYSINAGQTFEFKGVKLEPTVGYEGQWISHEDYEESGSVAALRFDRETYHIQYANVGLGVSKLFELETMSIIPKVKIRYSSDLSGGQRVHDSFQLAVDDPANKDNFYDKTGAIIGGDKLLIKAGVTAEVFESLTLDGTLSYTAAEEYSSYNLLFSAVKRF